MTLLCQILPRRASSQGVLSVVRRFSTMLA